MLSLIAAAMGNGVPSEKGIARRVGVRREELQDSTWLASLWAMATSGEPRKPWQ